MECASLICPSIRRYQYGLSTQLHARKAGRLAAYPALIMRSYRRSDSGLDID
jgi:hypothetical protein